MLNSGMADTFPRYLGSMLVSNGINNYPSKARRGEKDSFNHCLLAEGIKILNCAAWFCFVVVSCMFFQFSS